MRIERDVRTLTSCDAPVKATSVQLSLALCALVSLAACSGGNKESVGSKEQETPAVTGSAAGSAAPAATAAVKTYKLNDVVEYDAWTVTVLRVEPKWVSASERPEAGGRLVAIELQATNKGDKARTSPIPFFCTLVQSPGGEHLGLLLTGGPTPRFDRSTIPPNQPRTGWATFQAADMDGLLFQCEPGVAPDLSIDPDTRLIWNLGS